MGELNNIIAKIQAELHEVRRVLPRMRLLENSVKDETVANLRTIILCVNAMRRHRDHIQTLKGQGDLARGCVGNIESSLVNLPTEEGYRTKVEKILKRTTELLNELQEYLTPVQRQSFQETRPHAA